MSATKSRTLCWGVGLAALVTVTGCDQPRYQNRSLSSWAHDLDHRDDYKRRDACIAMAAIGPRAKGEVPKLIPLLDDANEGVQDFAQQALVAIGPAAVPALEGVLLTPAAAPASQRMHLAAALVKIDPTHAPAKAALVKILTGLGNEALAKRTQEIVVKEPSLVPQLVALLDEPYQPVRLQILGTLAQMGEPGKAALPAVMKAIADPDSKVRQQAITTAARIGKRAQVEPRFLALLDDADEDVAQSAALMLKYIGARESATGMEGQKGAAQGVKASDLDAGGRFKYDDE